MGTGGGADAAGESEENLSALFKCQPVTQKRIFLEDTGSVTSPLASYQQSNMVAVCQSKDALQLQDQKSVIPLFSIKVL